MKINRGESGVGCLCDRHGQTIKEMTDLSLSYLEAVIAILGGSLDICWTPLSPR
jgi:hypothetical protein